MANKSLLEKVKEIIYSCAYQVCKRPTEEKRRVSAIDVIWILLLIFLNGIVLNIFSLYQHIYHEVVVFQKSVMLYIIGLPLVVLFRVMIAKFFKDTRIIDVKPIHQLLVYSFSIVIIAFMVISGVYYGEMQKSLN